MSSFLCDKRELFDNTVRVCAIKEGGGRAEVKCRWLSLFLRFFNKIVYVLAVWEMGKGEG